MTSSARCYKKDVAQQLRSFRLTEERLNAGIYGVTAAGKSYFYVRLLPGSLPLELPLCIY